VRRWAGIGFGLALLCLAVSFRPVVQGDGINYFAYLHSLVVDHDLDFRNEYQAAEAAHLSLDVTLVATPTATGLVANFQPIGSALLALPFYLVALALQPGGAPQFSAPLVTAFTAASLCYGLLALVLSARLAAGAVGSVKAGLAGAVVAALTTPYVFYLLREPSYSHTFSAFAVSAFVLVWWRGREGRTGLGWFGLGVLGGLMGLVRIQDAPLAAIALLDLPGSGRRAWRAWPFLPGVALALTPQILVERTLFGTWLPYRPPAYALSFWPGHYAEVLVSSHNGLLTWSPVFGVAAVGLALLRDRRLALAALLALGIELAIEGSAPDWSGGLSFGMRRLLDLLPFVVVGLAELVNRLPERAWAAGAVALSGWNLLLVANFLYVLRTDRDPGLAGLLAGQVQALRFAPRLLIQGGFVRALAAGRPGTALALLAVEAGCLGLAALALWGMSRRVYSRQT
jgi:hypothetical protein